MAGYTKVGVLPTYLWVVRLTHRAGKESFEGREDHIVFVLGMDVMGDSHGAPGGRQLSQRRCVANPRLSGCRELLHLRNGLSERLEAKI